jgi:hypothetical protein
LPDVSPAPEPMGPVAPVAPQPTQAPQTAAKPATTYEVLALERSIKADYVAGVPPSDRNVWAKRQQLWQLRGGQGTMPEGYATFGGAIKPKPVAAARASGGGRSGGGSHGGGSGSGGSTGKQTLVLEKVPSANLLTSDNRDIALMLGYSGPALLHGPAEVNRNIQYMLRVDSEAKAKNKTPKYFTYDATGGMTGATSAARVRVNEINAKYKQMSSRIQYVPKGGRPTMVAKPTTAKAQYIAELKKQGATSSEIATLVKQKFGS